MSEVLFLRSLHISVPSLVFVNRLMHSCQVQRQRTLLWCQELSPKVRALTAASGTVLGAQLKVSATSTAEAKNTGNRECALILLHCESREHDVWHVCVP